MKQSLEKIKAWIKAHPKLAIGIGVVIVVIGYFVIKSQAGGGSDSTGSAIDGGSLGQNEGGLTASGGLDSLGSSASVMPSVTSTGGESPTSLVSSFPSGGDGASLAGFDLSGGGFGGGGYDTSVPPVISSEAPVSSAALVGGVANAAPGAVTKVIEAVRASVTPTPSPIKATAAAVVAKPIPAPSPIKAVAAAVVAKPAATVQAVKPAAVVSSIKATSSASVGTAKPPQLNKYSGSYKGYVWTGYVYQKL